MKNELTTNFVLETLKKELETSFYEKVKYQLRKYSHEDKVSVINNVTNLEGSTYSYKDKVLVRSYKTNPRDSTLILIEIIFLELVNDDNYGIILEIDIKEFSDMIIIEIELYKADGTIILNSRKIELNSREDLNKFNQYLEEYTIVLSLLIQSFILDIILFPPQKYSVRKVVGQAINNSMTGK